MRVNDLMPDPPYGEDEPLYKSILMVNGTHQKYSPCLNNHLPCLQFHSQCFLIDKLCLYELDLEHQMMHCRNGFHMNNCANFSCSQSFKCTSSYCIPVHYICDGEWHCPDGNDEQNCNISITPLCHLQDIVNLEQKLSGHVYKNFLNGTYIPAVIPWHDNKSSSLFNQLSCPGLFHCQYGQCVHPSLLCDGIVHCPLYADDETSCIVNFCPRNCTCTFKSVYCNDTQYESFPVMSREIHRLFSGIASSSKNLSA